MPNPTLVRKASKPANKKTTKPDYAAMRLRIAAFNDVWRAERRAARSKRNTAIEARMTELKAAAAAKGGSNG